jgi:hypothetical protein
MNQREAPFRSEVNGRISRKDIYTMPQYPELNTLTSREWNQLAKVVYMVRQFPHPNPNYFCAVIQVNKQILSQRGLTKEDIWRFHSLFKQAVYQLDGIDPQKRQGFLADPTPVATKTSKDATLDKKILKKLEAFSQPSMNPKWSYSRLRTFRIKVNGTIYSGICKQWEGAAICGIETFFNPLLADYEKPEHYKGWHRGNCDYYIYNETTHEMIHIPDLCPYQVGLFAFTQGFPNNGKYPNQEQQQQQQQQQESSRYCLDLERYLEFWNLREPIPELEIKIIPTWNRLMSGEFITEFLTIIKPHLRQALQHYDITNGSSSYHVDHCPASALAAVFKTLNIGGTGNEAPKMVNNGNVSSLKWNTTEERIATISQLFSLKQSILMVTRQQVHMTASPPALTQASPPAPAPAKRMGIVHGRRFTFDDLLLKTSIYIPSADATITNLKEYVVSV